MARVSPECIDVEVVLKRKDPSLPMFVAIPGPVLSAWALESTTVIEGRIEGAPLGRRTLKAWGRGQDAWFIEIPADVARRQALRVGRPVRLEIQLADTSTPEALEYHLSRDTSLAAAWDALSAAERRMASEHIRAAKRAPTRERRALSLVERLRAK